MIRYFFFIFLVSTLQTVVSQIPKIPFSPEKYVAYKSSETLCIDGKLNEDDWHKAQWTKPFVDIEGHLKPLPKYETRLKILWDENYLYFGIRIEEPHIWATLTKRESIIFNDNDFEIFIDPDGDTHNYIEYEINAFGTEWDLYMCKPYRDRCGANSKWNIEGIISKVGIQGSINNPNDIDTAWIIEIAMPWKSLIQYSSTKKTPIDGEQWRMNFSRVQWDTEIINGKYVKLKDQFGRNEAEKNWVWSPQGVIAMHQPETWAYVQFSENFVGTKSANFISHPSENTKWILRKLYYMQKQYHSKFKHYSDNFVSLQKDTCLINGYELPFEISSDKKNYQIGIPTSDHKKWYIRKDGKVWLEKY